MSHAFVGLVLFSAFCGQGQSTWCLPFCFVYEICSEIANEINYMYLSSIKKEKSIRLSSVVTTTCGLFPS